MTDGSHKGCSNTAVSQNGDMRSRFLSVSEKDHCGGDEDDICNHDCGGNAKVGNCNKCCDCAGGNFLGARQWLR